MDFREHSREIFFSALQAAEPGALVIANLQVTPQGIQIAGQLLPKNETGRIIVIAAGKAASSMALAAELQLGDYISSGVCVTKYGHSLLLQKIETIESGHPIPDTQSVYAGTQISRQISQLEKNDIVILLLSGGASSLVVDIPEGCTLHALRDTNELLVNSGADIHEINIVRKHLSRMKGGQLASAAFPARIFSLIISDVPGDDTSSIASGPVTPDPSTFRHALDILKKYRLTDKVPPAIRNYLRLGDKGKYPETPKPGNPVFSTVVTRIIGNNHSALLAARIKAIQSGYHTAISPDLLTGAVETRAREIAQHLLHDPGPFPKCLLWGGETTIHVTGHGTGGRNQQFALFVLDELVKNGNRDGTKNITVLCAGTDGTDGPTDASGAIADTTLIQSGYAEPEKISTHLAGFDAYPFFLNAGTLLFTGPTQTNVMDLVIGLIHEDSPPINVP